MECHSTAKTPVPGGNGRQPGLEIAPAISRFLGDSRDLSTAQELGLDGWRGAFFSGYYTALFGVGFQRSLLFRV